MPTFAIRYINHIKITFNQKKVRLECQILIHEKQTAKLNFEKKNHDDDFLNRCQKRT